MKPFFESVFNFETETSNMAIIALEGAKELGEKVDYYLTNWFNREAQAKGLNLHKDTFMINSVCPRFTSGDGKGLIKDTVRAKICLL